jgi:hypothetical protein
MAYLSLLGAILEPKEEGRHSIQNWERAQCKGECNGTGKKLATSIYSILSLQKN